MNRSSSAAAALALATAAIFPAYAENNALDGRSFQGVFLERGKTSGDADTLVFKDGRFRSLACDRYGYSDAPYKTASAGDSTRFEAQTESAKYGRLLWKGEVRGGKLDATAVMVRDGKSNVENWIVAAEKN
ncbi:MAG: hypothetical protein ABI789_00085 [Usitatibacter sp.]